MFNENLIISSLGQFDFNNSKIHETVTLDCKYRHELSIDPINEDLLKRIQNLILEIPFDSLLIEELPIFDLNYKMEDIQILGEYFTEKKEIFYYGKYNYQRIVQIHERYHVIHHLTRDPKTNEIWENFPQVDSFYQELLAQLFTYRYIMDFEPQLVNDFLKLNQNQSYNYKTWEYFISFDTKKVIKLYWKIRKTSFKTGYLKMFNFLHLQINTQLVKSLKFICENPLIHSSEMDLLQIVIRNFMTIEYNTPQKLDHWLN